MPGKAFEGVIENGQIRLKTKIDFSKKAKGYLIIPDLEIQKFVRIYSPRLVHPEQAIDFKKEIVEELPNAGL